MMRYKNFAIQDAAGWFQIPVALLLAGSAVELAIQVTAPAPVSFAGLLFDRFGSAMGLLVSLVGLVCLRYSDRHLDGHPGKGRFIRLMSCAIISAYTMVCSTWLPLLFLAWLATSLTLHELLTFRKDRPEALPPARKKFLISRLGDLALLAAIWLIWRGYGTLDLAQFRDILASVGPSVDVGLIAMLVVAAALAKSAQFPFHTWLPETMEAPTPVSALMHAGIINAGGVLLWRFAPALVLAPWAMLVLSAIGTLTFLMATLAMWAQPKVKRQLAWSTVAQMGFMMVQCGLGVFHAAVLHMLGHGCYKAYRFLSAGELGSREASRPAAPAAELSAWLIGSAASFPALAAACWWAGCSPWESAGELAMCWVAALAAGQYWVASAVRAPGSRLSRGAWCLMGTLAASVLAATLYGAAKFLWNPLPEGYPHPGGIATTLAAVIPVAALALLTVIRSLMPLSGGSSAATALRVHALNGFYLGTIADMWVARVWSVSARERGNAHA